MPVLAIAKIKEYITVNGPSTKAELVVECAAYDIREDRVDKCLDRLVNRGKLTESGGDYSLV